MRMWTTASVSWGDSMPEPFLRKIIMLFELEAIFQTPGDRIVKKEWNTNLDTGGRWAFCRCCNMNDWINPFPSSSTFSSSITLSAIWGGEVSIDLIIFHLADYLQTWSYSSWVIGVIVNWISNFPRWWPLRTCVKCDSDYLEPKGLGTTILLR